MVNQSMEGRFGGPQKQQRRGSNINLSPQDLARLLSQGQPGNVTGDSAHPGSDPIMNSFRNEPLSISDALAKQRQMERASFDTKPLNAPVANNPAIDPVTQIMQQLQKLMTQQGGLNFQPSQLPSFDPNKYKNQAESAVNEQYDPIIQGIVAQQGQTQQRARQNRVALRDLYAGAVNEINAGSAKTQASYDQGQAQSQQLYTDERNKIAAGYAADAAAQRAEAKRLGTEALGVNEAITAQNSDKQFADQMESQQMLAANNALEQQQQSAGQYDKSIAQATSQEGINSQQDIMNQLADYMSQSNQDITGVRSQEAGATNDLMYKLAQAAYDRDSQNAQFQYQQQRDYIGDQKDLYGMQRDMLLQQLDAAQKAQAAGSSEKLNPWQQVATFADQLQPGHGSDVVSAIQNAMANRGEIYARSKDDPVPMNPALFAKLVADYQGNQGMDRNTLMQAAQELYRLLYGTS